MLLTPRTYSASQTPDRIFKSSDSPSRLRFRSFEGWMSDPAAAGQATEMLLIRQTGSVRVGEVVRYTLTYDPASDNIQPPPDALHVKVKNTSAIPLRAAYLHGPYTLYVSCYPASFDPNDETNVSRADNTPQFEPYLKAGGTWNAVIPVPAYDLQENSCSAQSQDGQCLTWIIEIISQVVFSSTASVNFEVLVGRNEASLDPPTGGQPRHLRAADLREHWPSGSQGKQVLINKGVYTDSITLLVDDTASLWNTPQLPSSRSEDIGDNPQISGGDFSVRSADTAAGAAKTAPSAAQKEHRKRIHLVVLTHGLHSNLGADMLYLKERIDAASKKAASQRKNSGSQSDPALGSRSLNSVDDDCQEEQVVVRGFPGNAARTERGIQYLGKRLAKYVLLMTYPDQPHLPHKKPKSRTYPNLFSWGGPRETNEATMEALPTDMEPPNLGDHHAYQITSISFIGHSLGGLVQTYAIAYIQKHSPDFFDKIQPINFIALATPFLGLSNENPMYVRFALDFGLVGRTGQDLGLSWTVPRVKSGWETIIGGKAESKSHGHSDARAKPLLRILPSGPAHEVLTKFKHRTVYSNLVNDGIVPLRTSCLLFLDWKGLERVDKARRENGIVGTMAEWGWAELTGANSKSPRPSRPIDDLEVMGTSSGITKNVEETSITAGSRSAATTILESPSLSSSAGKGSANQVQSTTGPSAVSELAGLDPPIPQSPASPLNAFFSMFKPGESGNKHTKVLKRSQTVATSLGTDHSQQDDHHYNQWSYDGGFNAPPKTTVFESAGDILMPPLPPMEYIMNPASRPRTILHDRTYRAEDIPPPVMKRKTQPIHPSYDDMSTATYLSVEEPSSGAGLRVEEKIARAYHRGLSWRKCLVRLEPDAHNNIIVRRMFTNAYGWPVVQHLVDTHFGSSSSDGVEDNPEHIEASPIRPVAPAEDVECNFTPLSSTILGPHVAKQQQETSPASQLG
ncbi:putative serine esterase-domain-containing protein [Aspergillus granulosus]|uniref:Serine esterase-domain-containing protein n=1 Tax=Aspergillus granulosus TaxID=176169 RepID=A0ABR4HMQ9_9EURO